ncbi:ATP-grasp domain-containing protein [Acidithiobacillus sp. AC3]
MSRVLLVDTNVAAAPIYRWLLAEGYDVHVVGSNPADFLARSASNYVQVDYSQPGILAELVDRLAIDFLVPGCNDRSYLACAVVSERYRRFPGIEPVATTETINQKAFFRRFAREYDLATPRQFVDADEINTWPVIVKPADAFSGRGVSVVHADQHGALPEAIARAVAASASSQYVIEAFVSGQLYSHSAFLYHGDILVDFIVEEHGSANPFVVDTSRLINNFDQTMLERIREDIRKMARTLGLADGLIHTQFIATHDRHWLIEITRRCPGDLYSLLIEHSAGVPYAALYAMPFLGRPLALSTTPPQQRWIMRHTLSVPAVTSLGGLRFHQPLDIVNFIPLARAGDRLQPSPFSRIGLLFTRHDSPVALERVFQAARQRQLYSVEENEFWL